MFSLCGKVKLVPMCIANFVLLLQLFNVCVTEGDRIISARDAIKRFDARLLQQLPLESRVFFAMVKHADLFPLGTGDIIAAEPTRKMKVNYFLKHVAEPGAEECLPKLLKVMKDSTVANLVRLADGIQAATGISMYIYSYIAKSFIFA